MITGTNLLKVSSYAPELCCLFAEKCREFIALMNIYCYYIFEFEIFFEFQVIAVTILLRFTCDTYLEITYGYALSIPQLNHREKNAPFGYPYSRACALYHVLFLKLSHKQKVNNQANTGGRREGR